MDDSERAKALLDLYKQQMEHFRHTQDIEWKANFGIWTFLAVATYTVSKEPVNIPHISHWSAIAIALAVVLVHAIWLYKIHSSEVSDKQLWSCYRREALLRIRENQSIHQNEEPWTRNLGERLIWLLLEVMMTALLCVFLLASLFLRIPK